MKSCLVYQQRDALQPVPFEAKILDQVLATRFPLCAFTVVTNLEDFEARIKTEAFDLVVFDWTSYHGPSQVVEIYFQSKHCRVPMVVWLNKPGNRDKAFLQEYGVIETAEVRDPKVVIAYQDLLSLMQETVTPTNVRAKVRHALIRLNYHINNGKTDNAKALFEKIRTALSAPVACYYDARLLLLQNDVEAAKQRILKETAKNVQLMDLLGNIFFNRDEVAKALTCFTKAHEVSPINLRRGYLISKCQDALSETQPEMRVASMTSLLNLNRLCPSYPGINGKIVKMIIASEDLGKLPIVNDLLLKLESGEVLRIYKTIGTFKEPFKSAFTDTFIRAMSKIANGMIVDDDLTALKYYKYIAKLLPEGDSRLLPLDYCTARAYFRFGQLDMAQEINDKVIAASKGTFEKSVTLAKLIDGAKKGEFDVLLDDESDWQITKKAS